MTSPGRLGNNPEFQALRAQVAMINRRLGIQQTVTNAVVADGAQPAKRFRIGVFITGGLISGGGTVTGTVTWSSPMPSDVYNVDVACSAVTGQLTSTVTSQTATGCTVSFVAPLTILGGATCIVLGVAPAT